MLDKCHNTRNLGEYEGLVDVDKSLVADLITATQAVADALGRCVRLCERLACAKWAAAPKKVDRLGCAH